MKSNKKTFEFDYSKIDVDIIRAYNHFQSAKLSIKNEDYQLAVKQTCDMLEIIGNNVVFPGLYDIYFEELREKIETESRNVIVELSKILIKNNNFNQAEEVLERSLNMLKNDDELKSLLVLCS